MSETRKNNDSNPFQMSKTQLKYSQIEEFPFKMSSIPFFKNRNHHTSPKSTKNPVKPSRTESNPFPMSETRKSNDSNPFQISETQLKYSLFKEIPLKAS